MTFHPTDVCADFQEDRLQLLAELFATCRDGALDSYDPGAGETAWSLGCRSYERITFAIEQLALAGAHPWLSLVQGRMPGEQFVFRVGSQPVKFYTGSPTRPNARTLRVDHPEIRALNLLPTDDGLPAGAWVWRIAIGVDAEGKVAQVTILQATRGGSVKNPYSIPFSRNPAGNIVPLFEQQSGIELDRPEIETWDDVDEAEDGGNKNS